MVWLLLLILALLGFFYERSAERRFRAKSAPRSGVTNIRGRGLHLHCQGERRPGRPTVIFEAGHGAWSSGWQRVMPEIARLTRTCAEDRAGYGWSEDGPAQRQPERIVADLHELLVKNGETGPYIFVGHSMGAAIGRLFASRYPEEVLGMVWVDSAHEQIVRFMPVGQWAFWLFTAGCWLGALLARIGLLRLTGLGRLIARYPSVTDPRDAAALLEQVCAPLYLETVARETITLTTPGGWARTCATFERLPLIMLEAQYPALPRLGFFNRFRRGWSAMQDDLAARAAHVQRIKVDCGHNIQSEQPEAVIAAVKQMLSALPVLQTLDEREAQEE